MVLTLLPRQPELPGAPFTFFYGDGNESRVVGTAVHVRAVDGEVAIVHGVQPAPELESDFFGLHT